MAPVASAPYKLISDKILCLHLSLQIWSGSCTGTEVSLQENNWFFSFISIFFSHCKNRSDDFPALHVSELKPKVLHII